jgi:hypothetical protein
MPNGFFDLFKPDRSVWLSPRYAGSLAGILAFSSSCVQSIKLGVLFAHVLCFKNYFAIGYA